MIIIETKLVSLLFTSILSTTGGAPYFGFRPTWGYGIECVCIAKVMAVPLRECYQQCSSRGICLSFNYIVRYKHCIMCLNDTTTRSVTRSPGVVYGQIVTSNKAVQANRCNCSANQRCDIQDDSFVCKTTECQQWPVTNTITNATLTIYGNRRQVYSNLVLRCAIPRSSQPVARVTCSPDGQWSPFNLACSVYIGCVKDSLQRTLEKGHFFNRHMTNDMCLQICKQQFENASIIYHGTEDGNECYCSGDYQTREFETSARCVEPCSGNKKEICGDDWALSIYKYMYIG